MDIDIAHPASSQLALLNEMQDFLICCNQGGAQQLQLAQHDFARSQMTKRNLADDEGVNEDLPVGQ